MIIIFLAVYKFNTPSARVTLRKESYKLTIMSLESYSFSNSLLLLLPRKFGGFLESKYIKPPSLLNYTTVRPTVSPFHPAPTTPKLGLRPHPFNPHIPHPFNNK